jgi:hypothetical protein
MALQMLCSVASRDPGKTPTPPFHTAQAGCGIAGAWKAAGSCCLLLLLLLDVVAVVAADPALLLQLANIPVRTPSSRSMQIWPAQAPESPWVTT